MAHAEPPASEPVATAAHSPSDESAPHGIMLDAEYRWLLGILGLSAVALLVSGALGWRLYSLNQRLAREAEQRRSAEARYRLLIEAAPLPVLVLTPDGRRVLYANPRARTILGSAAAPPAPTQGLNSKLSLFASPEDGVALLRAVNQGTTVTDREVRLRRGDGRAVWVHLSADTISYEGEDAVFLAFADITDRRAAEFRLRDSERRLRMLTDNMVDVIWTLDESLRFTFVSPSVLTLCGHTVEDFLAKPADQTLPLVVRQHLEALAQSGTERAHRGAIQGHMDASIESDCHRKDGSTFWAEITMRLFFDDQGRFTGAQGLTRDVTDRRNLEEELRRSNADLEQFAYAVSHDLQQPLRMVSQFLGLLKRRLGERLKGDEREFLDFAMDGAANMHDMIRDLLEFSRIGRGEIRQDLVPLDRPLDSAVRILDSAIKDAGATVERQPLPTVLGDENQLTRLLQNLLDNALKYVDPQRPPLISISARPAPGGLCEISLTDNGIGVDPKQIRRLFAVFQRLSPSGEYPGTGVGLAICRRIVERHGGRIRLESDGKSHGATVAFTLPLPTETEGGAS